VKARLLFEDKDIDLTAPLPPGHEDLVQDLELTILLHAMAGGDKLLYEVAGKVLLAPLPDPGAIRYRQQILADCLAHPEVIRDIYALATAALTDRTHYWGLYGASYQTPSSNLSGALSHLESYAARLRQLRKIADDNAGTFRSAGLTALFTALRDQLTDEYFAEVSRHLKRLHFREGVLISAELAADNTGANFMLCASAESARYPWLDRLRIGPRSSYSFALAPRDEAGGRILEDLASRGLNLVANAAAQSADHIGSYFAMLRAEAGFYVTCLNLHERLTAADIPVAFPDPAAPATGTFSCTDLRDAALALQTDDQVVGNDVTGDGKTLVIITGANSGGKSTFLRSVGQAQLMMQCGLFTAAASYAADAATGIFTHFIRAEDPSMTSGRLDDELRRMSVIASRLGPHGLVLFNESFAGTNEREGSEIGYQVVSALTDAQVKVLFVTHRYDFADRFRRQRAATTLFLRAERHPDGRRNFKLAVADPLPTSFGEDLYYELGGWLDENRSLTPNGSSYRFGGRSRAVFERLVAGRGLVGRFGLTAL
jgi:DNA mismatch repair ATPase MutS